MLITLYNALVLLRFSDGTNTSPPRLFLLTSFLDETHAEVRWGKESAPCPELNHERPHLSRWLVGFASMLCIGQEHRLEQS